MQKHGLKYIFDYSKSNIQIFYSCVFDVQYTIVSDTAVSFSTSNLIRVEFKFNCYLVFLFIVTMEISIFLKNILYQTSIQFQYLV